MAVKGRRVSVGSQPTKINSTTADQLSGSALVMTNRGAVAMFLGGATVTVTTGYELPSGQGLTFQLDEGEALYGIVAAGTAEAHVLERGV